MYRHLDKTAQSLAAMHESHSYEQAIVHAAKLLVADSRGNWKYYTQFTSGTTQWQSPDGEHVVCIVFPNFFNCQKDDGLETDGLLASETMERIDQAFNDLASSVYDAPSGTLDEAKLLATVTQRLGLTTRAEHAYARQESALSHQELELGCAMQGNQE